MPSLTASLDLAARRIVPLGTVLIAVLLDLLPLTTLAPDAVRPSLVLVVVYFWTLYRPDLLGPVGLFGMGIVADAIGGTPLGLSPLLLLLIRLIVLVPQRVVLARSFIGGWLGMAIVTLVVESTRWLIGCLFAARVFTVDTVLTTSLLTIACYPPLALLLGRANGEIDAHATGN